MDQKYVMVDIETSGLKPSESEILQIAMLEVIKDPRGYFYPGRSFEKILHFDKEVTDEWILKTHKDLLPRCKAATYQSPVEVRAEIVRFFQQTGQKNIYLMGLNASVFDYPWLVNKGYLKEGDVHYRIFELTGAYGLAQAVLHLNGDRADDRKTFFEMANGSCEWIELPKGVSAHDAIYDCYSQLKTLNGCIKLLRK